MSSPISQPLAAPSAAKASQDSSAPGPPAAHNHAAPPPPSRLATMGVAARSTERQASLAQSTADASALSPDGVAQVERAGSQRGMVAHDITAHDRQARMRASASATPS